MAQHKKEMPRWLARIQEQSWEPEILISGIVLLALFQLPPKFMELREYLIKFSYPIFYTGTIDDTLTNVMRLAVYWLIVAFSAHLMFRSIWVAFVGLSYVYPGGIKKSKLYYAKRYMKHIRADQDPLDKIKKLESLCSSMFALGFLFFMIVFGFLVAFLIITVFFLCIVQISPDFAYYGIIDKVFISLFLIYIIDFISLGLLKRIPYISAIYYPLYRFLSFITLSFLYRDVLYHFISNHKKWKVFLFVLIFTSISIFADVASRNKFDLLNDIEINRLTKDKQVMFTEHYENLAKTDIIYRIQIERDIIKDDFLKAFIAHNSVNETFRMKDSCFVNDTVYALSASLSDSIKLSCLNNFYLLQVDDSVFTSDYYFMKHPKTNQPGLMAYLDVSYLDKGMHKLHLLYRNTPENRESIPYLENGIVEFIKQ